jgi:hypothetical protein
MGESGEGPDLLFLIALTILGSADYLVEPVEDVEEV